MMALPRLFGIRVVSPEERHLMLLIEIVEIQFDAPRQQAGARLVSLPGGCSRKVTPDTLAYHGFGSRPNGFHSGNARC